MRAKPLLFAVAAIALIVIGFIVFRGPKPEVVLAPEPLFYIGGFLVTNTILTGWLVVIVVVGFLLTATRKMSLVPSGFQNLVEALVEWALDLVEGIAGHKNGRRFFPLILSIFLYVMIGNWMGLLPGFSSIGLPFEAHHGVYFVESKVGPLNLAIIPLNPTEVAAEEGAEHHSAAPNAAPNAVVSSTAAGANDSHAAATQTEPHDGTFLGVLHPFFRSVNTDVNMTLAIALVSFVFVEWWGLKTLGIGYLGKFFAFPPFAKGGSGGGPIGIFVGILELISEFIRIISFTFRLFGNIFAGEVLLLMMTFLVPFLFVLPFYFLELFVGFIQASVFALLTLVFASMAVESHGDHEDHAEHGDHGAPVAAPAH